MSNIKKLYAYIFILVLFLLLPIGSLQAMEKQTENFSILFSGNVYGETEPCG